VCRQRERGREKGREGGGGESVKGGSADLCVACEGAFSWLRNRLCGGGVARV
jgi:hypothetical protein